MSKREDIITAALDIISEQGISALTLPVLFKQAKTGAGAFYHYFDDRSVLINGIFERCFDTVGEFLSDVCDLDLPPEEWFTQAIIALFECQQAHPKEMNFLYSFTYARVMPERDFCRVIPSVALLTRIFSDAQAEGLIGSEVSPIVNSRVVRAMLASVFLCAERGDFELSEASAQKLAKAVWIGLQAGL